MSEAQKLNRFSMQTNFDVLNPQQFIKVEAQQCGQTTYRDWRPGRDNGLRSQAHSIPYSNKVAHRFPLLKSCDLCAHEHRTDELYPTESSVVLLQATTAGIRANLSPVALKH